MVIAERRTTRIAEPGETRTFVIQPVPGSDRPAPVPMTTPETSPQTTPEAPSEPATPDR
jgi:hypothetical protein